MSSTSLQSKKAVFYQWLAYGLFVLLCLDLSRPAHAAPANNSAASAAIDSADDETESTGEPAPIEELQKRLAKTHHSKTAKAVKKAYDALRKKDFALAIQLATKEQGSETYADYGYWISSVAYRQQAQQQLTKGLFPAAIASAEKSIQLALQIESKNPYSNLVKQLPKDLAQTELLIGEGNWGNKKWVNAEKAYERAFQRLLILNSLSSIKVDYIGHYADLCKLHFKPEPNLYCKEWIQKLATHFVKKAEETKVISASFPEVYEQLKSFRPASKVTIPYKGNDEDQVAFEAAMKIYFEEKYGQATKSFHVFLDEFPRSEYRFRLRYWLGQSLSHEQEHEKAKKTYEDLQADTPLSYYGLLAANASGKPFDANIGNLSPLATDTDPWLQAGEALHLKRAKAFIAEQAYDLAALELKDLKARDGLTSPFLVYLAMLNYAAGNHRNGFQVLQDLIQRGYPGIFSTFGLQMIFPTPFLNEIKKNAVELGVDPILILSLIKQESAFDEDANSSTGASGLMQLMPATASETEPTISSAELLEADANIRVGTKYLKKLLGRFNGNIALALASYNAGPHAVDRWLKDTPQKKGMLVFIEAIPYKETREYVAAIIRNYFWYSRQLSGISRKDLNYFWNVYGPPESPPKLPTTPPGKP